MDVTLPLRWIRGRHSSILLTGGVAIVYIGAYLPLYAALGNSTGILSTLPVLVAAWYFGPRVGALCGLLTFPVNAPTDHSACGAGVGRLGSHRWHPGKLRGDFCRVCRRVCQQLASAELVGMSRELLKLSGSLVHDYATISDDSPSPNRASRARRAATSAGIS